MPRTLPQEDGGPQSRDRQLSASTGKQREIPILSGLKSPSMAEAYLVESCTDSLMAINRCMDLSGLTDEVIAGRLGIDKGHMSRIRRGRAHFPTKKRVPLMQLCGNLLPAQYDAHCLGCKLEPIAADERIRRLERELAEARLLVFSPQGKVA